MTTIGKITLRKDISSNWTTSNPVLESGELGLDTTLDKIKIGNGITSWNSLPFKDYTKAEIDSLIAGKADSTLVYSIIESNNLLLAKADVLTTYTKTQVDDSLVLKADVLTTYTKTQVDDSLALKSNILTTESAFSATSFPAGALGDFNYFSTDGKLYFCTKSGTAYLDGSVGEAVWKSLTLADLV